MGVRAQGAQSRHGLRPHCQWEVAEQPWGCANPRALDRQHPELGLDAAGGGKAGELVIRAQDPMTWEDDRQGVAAKRLSYVLLPVAA